MRKLTLFIFLIPITLLATRGARAGEDLSRPGLHVERGFDAEYSPYVNASPKRLLLISVEKPPSIALEIHLRTRPSSSGCKFARHGLARFLGFHPVITDVFSIPAGTSNAQLRVAIDGYTAKDCRWTAADIGVRYSQPAKDGAAFSDRLDWKFAPRGDADARVNARCVRSSPARNARTLLSCSFEAQSAQTSELSRAGGRLSLHFSMDN
ncbi:hypothetical protein G3N59_11430 [Paraburkholderia sp. Ac-20340]|uniref:hypothetical protein n=1 Tax=Paraburkholderia sp. Ac-20340 TaxID=2703888 RepID=UPI00197CC232|nr:hypothetical protein [Paraburkholderia sp. Ac-20340]MBN3853990.1 hypothetical protein [Paraburkholderia sp. Ac-20340]